MPRYKLFNRGIEVNEFAVLVFRYLTILALFSLSRILFYLFNTGLFPHVTFPSFMRMMRGGVLFDDSALLYLNIPFFIFSLLPFSFKYQPWYQKGLKWLFVTFNGLAIGLNCIDFIYYRFILKRTTASIFGLLDQLNNKASLGLSFLFDFWYVLLIWVLFMLILVWSAGFLKPKRPVDLHRWTYIPKSLLALVIVAFLCVIGIRGGYMSSTRPINMNNAGKYVNSPEEMAIVQNTPFCIIRTLGKNTFEIKKYFTSDDELEKVYTPVKIPRDSIPMRKDNVVIFILESFSREFVGSLNRNLNNGTYKGYTPFLDSIISQSLVFPNAFANGRKSIDAIPSVTASIPALVLPYVLSERSGNRINSLASALSAEGYETAFFHSAPNGSMGFDAFTKIAGFQHYFGKNEYGRNEGFDGIWGIWDEPFFQYFAGEMNKMKPPFFTTLFSVSSHHPFKVPQQYISKFPEEHIPLQKCIRYTDFALKEFFDKARTMPWFKNTLFVITADHCSESDFREYRTLVNDFAIPLIFYKPDGSLKGSDPSIAEQIDIMPTVLGYLHYPKPYIAFGNNLFDPAGKRFAINFIEESYQFLIEDYALYFSDGNFTGIYNWKKDPERTTNLLGKMDFSKEEALYKAVVQQYNNRMVRNELTISQNTTAAR
jgi:phosphoglycerol transferase MdoB-like AlkP superfamily enzyme